MKSTQTRDSSFIVHYASAFFNYKKEITKRTFIAATNNFQN